MRFLAFSRGKRIEAVATDSGTDLARAAQIIRQGGIVALPTETWYGLAVNPFDNAALERLLAVKGREKDQAILLLITPQIDLSKIIACEPPAAKRLREKYWPGPLTILFPAHKELSLLLTAGTGKIGLRYSSHSLLNRLINDLGLPLTGTSANLSGKPPGATPAAVREQLAGKIDYILDGGSTAGQGASTVVDATGERLAIVRQGIITIAME